MVSKIMPTLHALNPRNTPIPTWQALMAILQELVDVFAELKGERDFYCPYFPTRGGPRTDYMDVWGNPAGPVFICLFPGVVKRFWVEQSQSWIQGLLVPAVVAMESTLAGD
jgi:hypothetical protein